MNNKITSRTVTKLKTTLPHSPNKMNLSVREMFTFEASRF